MRFVEPEWTSIPEGAVRLGLSDAQMDDLSQTDPEAREWAKAGRFDRERPDHVVSVQPFRLALTPVTVAEYRCFVAGDGYHEATYWTIEGWKWRMREMRSFPEFWGESPWTDSEDLPIVGVSW